MLLAVGAANTILKSTNRGVTWSATAAGVTGAHSAVAVLTPQWYEIGTLDTTGKVWWTENGGATWTQRVLPGAALTAIQDIVYPSLECGFICATRTGPVATIFATTYGGSRWGESNTSRLPGNLTVFARANRLAVPQVSDVMIATNNVAIAGLGGGFTDGIILIGSAPVL